MDVRVGLSKKLSTKEFMLLNCAVGEDSWESLELQHIRLPCPSQSPGACSNSCPLSQCCHPTISSIVIPFSFCLQSFPTSGSFLMSWLFASGGQSIGASVSASVLPVNIQGWFPLGLNGLISLQSKDSQESYLTPQFKSIKKAQPSLYPTLHIHLYITCTHSRTKVLFKFCCCSV